MADHDTVTTSSSAKAAANAALIVSALLATAVVSAAADPVPAPTLSKPVTAERAVAADGFIQRWLILEPQPASALTDEAVQVTVKKEPFLSQLTQVPADGDRLKVGDAELVWHAEDTKLYNVNLFHFARALGRRTTGALFWVATVVNSPVDMPGLRLAIGSNAASIWWLNGVEVIGIYGDRQTVIDDGVSLRLTLKKGPNLIRAAIVNGGGATDFCARFLDSADKPVKGLTINLRGGGGAR
jgi:hypothetical protein